MVSASSRQLSSPQVAGRAAQQPRGHGADTCHPKSGLLPVSFSLWWSRLGLGPAVLRGEVQGALCLRLDQARAPVGVDPGLGSSRPVTLWAVPVGTFAKVLPPTSSCLEAWGFSLPGDAASMGLALVETVRTFPKLDDWTSRAIKRRLRGRLVALAFMVPQRGGRASEATCDRRLFSLAVPAPLRPSPRGPHFGLLSYRGYLSDVSPQHQLFP